MDGAAFRQGFRLLRSRPLKFSFAFGHFSPAPFPPFANSAIFAFSLYFRSANQTEPLLGILEERLGAVGLYVAARNSSEVLIGPGGVKTTKSGMSGG